MKWVRENYVAVLVAAAILLSFVIGRYDATQQALHLREGAVTGCVRVAPRATIAAAFMVDAARVRAAAGAEKVARQYREYARGLLRTIPHPGPPQQHPLLAGVVSSDGAFVPSPTSVYLIRKGCEKVYPKP